MKRVVPALPLLHAISTSLVPAVVLGWPHREPAQGDWQHHASTPEKGSSQLGVVLVKLVIKQQQAQTTTKSYFSRRLEKTEAVVLLYEPRDPKFPSMVSATLKTLHSLIPWSK